MSRGLHVDRRDHQSLLDQDGAGLVGHGIGAIEDRHERGVKDRRPFPGEILARAAHECMSRTRAATEFAGDAVADRLGRARPWVVLQATITATMARSTANLSTRERELPAMPVVASCVS